MKVFWLVYGLAVILLLLIPLRYVIFSIIIFLVLFILTGYLAYLLGSNKTSLKKIAEMIERIDIKPLEMEVKKLEMSQRECYLRLFKLENALKEYELDQEKKYRDVVRKVLEVDNKLNTKFNLLGEAILKLSKEKDG